MTSEDPICKEDMANYKMIHVKVDERTHDELCRAAENDRRPLNMYLRLQLEAFAKTLWTKRIAQEQTETTQETGES